MNEKLLQINRSVDATEEAIAILQWRNGPGEVNTRSGLRYDSDAKEIVICEEALMRAIMLLNRNQKPRRIRIESENESRHSIRE